MAGNFPGRERRNVNMRQARYDDGRDERGDAHNDARWGRQQERHGDDGYDSCYAGGRDDRAWQDRREGERYRQRGGEWQARSRASGSGNYASDWSGEQPDARGMGEHPDHTRGGGFGGPQDPYSRGAWEDEAPGVSRGGLGAMPGALPAGRGGQQYGRGLDWSGQQGGDTGRYGGDERRPERSYRGIGPKGYQRSDERLKEVVCERLCDDDRIDASEISLEVENGEVTVEGMVPRRAMKYCVEDVIEQCGVTEIHNRLRVEDRSRTLNSQNASGYEDKASPGRGPGQPRAEHKS